MTHARIELRGRLLRAPDLRVTPSGKPVMRIAVDCGEATDRLQLEVVMAGEPVSALAAALKVGDRLRASGYLRSVMTASPSGLRQSRLEVAAETISQDTTRQ